MTLITDRTEEDSLLGNEKGTYGYSDLNRVENAVSEIAKYFSILGSSANMSIKTDWGAPGDFSIDTFPVKSQMERYLSNVEYINMLFAVDLPLPDSMDKLTWDSANMIEEVLRRAAGKISAIINTYRYSGEIYAGEDLI